MVEAMVVETVAGLEAVARAVASEGAQAEGEARGVAERLVPFHRGRSLRL